MSLNLEAALKQERDRLDRLLTGAGRHQQLLGESPARDELPDLIRALKGAIDQIEIALEDS